MVPPPDNDDWRAWRRKIDKRLEDGDKRFERNEQLAAERYRTAGERHREIMAAITGLRAKKLRELPEYSGNDEDEISDVTDINEVKRRARRQRDRAQANAKWKKWGRLAAPMLLGAGAGIWELIKLLQHVLAAN